MKPLVGNERILVRVPSWVGDAVAAEPVLRALYARVAAPGASGPDSLALAGPRHLLSVYDGLFEGALRIPHNERGGESVAAWRGYDLAVLLTGSFRSAWTAFRARIPRRLGWERDGRGLLLTDGLRPGLERGLVPSGLGVVGRYPRYLPRSYTAACAELLAQVGIEVEDLRPQLAVQDTAVGAVGARLAQLGIDLDEPFIVAHAGSRPKSAKAWSPVLWARMLDSLSIHVDMPVLLVCGPGEEAPLGDIVERSRFDPLVPLFEPVLDLAELAALCSRAKLVVSTDTGPRHVASAVGAPVVAICGPTDPRHTSDQLDRTSLVRIEVPCGPCHLETCPLEGAEHHSCMRLVDPERVLAAMRPWLAKPSTPVPFSPTP